MLKRIWQFFFPLRDSQGAKHPPRTWEMQRAGLTWGLIKIQVPDTDGVPDYVSYWGEVCDFCGGNCGQCGITARVGNVPALLDAIVKNGNWDSGNHAGFPRG